MSSKSFEAAKDIAFLHHDLIDAAANIRGFADLVRDGHPYKKKFDLKLKKLLGGVRRTSAIVLRALRSTNPWLKAATRAHEDPEEFMTQEQELARKSTSLRSQLLLQSLRLNRMATRLKTLYQRSEPQFSGIHEIEMKHWRQSIDAIHQQANTLCQLIEDTIAAKEEPFDLRNTIEDLEKTHTDVQYTLPEEEVLVHGRKPLIFRAIENLIRNAKKHAYTERPPDVRVRVEKENSEALIKVRDDGGGIPPEHLDKIFELFFTTHKYGTGLGLAFVKHAVEQHRGTISAKSVVGKGTEFVIRLPLHKPLNA